MSIENEGDRDKFTIGELKVSGKGVKYLTPFPSEQQPALEALDFHEHDT